MQESLLEIVNAVSAQVWGPPMLVLLVGTGLYLTFLLKGVQFRAIFHSLYLAFVKRKEEGAEGEARPASEIRPAATRFQELAGGGHLRTAGA